MIQEKAKLTMTPLSVVCECQIRTTLATQKSTCAHTSIKIKNSKPHKLIIKSALHSNTIQYQGSKGLCKGCNEAWVVVEWKRAYGYI